MGTRTCRPPGRSGGRETATPGTLRSRASDGTQDWAPSMYLTASPTVARFLTSSSGMRTSNFSSALTTMVIIEMESMSRSSVKDLSSLTSSVATPVSSLTISARPARISVSVCAMVSPRLMFCLAVKDYPREGGFSVSRHGWSVWRDRLHPPHATGSGEDQHLPGVCQACAEPELHEHVAALGGALLDEPVGGQRDRGRRGVAGLADVAGDDHVVPEAELLGELVDDAHVRLVGGEDVDVLDGQPWLDEHLADLLGGVPHGPAEDGAAVLLEGGPLGGAVAEVDEGTRHPDGVPVVPVAAPHGRADLGLLARADDGCARPVAQQERDGTIGGRDEVRELLRTDHQHVAGAAGTDQGIGLADPVTEAGAGCGDVVGDHVRAAQLPGQQRRERGGRVREGDGGDDDRVQGLQLDAGGLDGLAGGGEGEVLDADVLAGAGAGDDPGALADPLVGGVDRADQIVVGDLQVAAGGAVGQHLGAGDGRMGTQAHGHVSSPRCR